MAAPALSPTPTLRVERRPSLLTATAVVALLATIKLVIHLFAAGNYGLFGDELYFLATSEHLAWGYVDMPPLTALQALVARTLFGESTFGIHVMPALLGAALVLVAALIVHELGGGALAQGLAGVGILIAGIYLTVNSYLSMNSVEPLIWMGCAWLVIRMTKTGDTRLWLWFGTLAGLGLLNKHTMAVFGAALLAGLLLTPARRLMFNRWFLLGGAIAFALFLPNLVWMIRNDFPFLELQANIRENQRNVNLTPLEFLRDQVIFLQPLTLPLWLGGLAYFLFHPAGKAYRSLSYAYLLALAFLLITQARAYYLSPAYPMLFAGGGVLFEGWATTRPRRWAIVVYLALVLVGGVLTAPHSLPILQPEQYLAYRRVMPLGTPELEMDATGKMPQLYADRFGWHEMVDKVAEAYRALPPEEQREAAIFGEDYGQAGAIDLYGPALGLPKAISGHLSYWDWGPRDASGEVTIVLKGERAELEQLCDSVELGPQVTHRYSMPRERFWIYICRGLKVPFQQLWPEVKRWE
jgi:hypothetical protein